MAGLPSLRARPLLAAFTAVIVVTLATHLWLLRAPLLEGAAGKQTHTAMIARNLHRGLGSFTRPVVDDIGKPGYFIKELPLLAGSAALIYGAIGGPDDAVGRILSLLAWLAGLPVLVSLLRRQADGTAVTVAAAWWLVAPMAFMYARAFMSDAAMVTASLATLLALVRFRERHTVGRAVACGALLMIALLLKPHAVFWLAPAAGFVRWSRQESPGAHATSADRVLLGVVTLGVLVAVAWYLHAAAVHRQYPAAGTTRLDGWFAPSALASAALYREILRQVVMMVLTPIGTLVALAGIVLGARSWSLVERALLAWGGGVLVQCLVFNTRMFDDAARGTEYYQLALVPVAAMLLGRGVGTIARRAGDARAPMIAAGILILLSLGAAREIHAALEIPERYRRILADCDRVRAVTRPHDELFVLADRGGTILYYCDRRGTTFVPARAVDRVFARGDNVVGVRHLADALDRATFVYVPFPELLGENSKWLALFDDGFQRVDTPGSDMRLYRRRGPARSG
jgi:hypothetical protein